MIGSRSAWSAAIALALLATPIAGFLLLRPDQALEASTSEASDLARTATPGARPLQPPRPSIDRSQLAAARSIARRFASQYTAYIAGQIAPREITDAAPELIGELQRHSPVPRRLSSATGQRCDASPSNLSPRRYAPWPRSRTPADRRTGSRSTSSAAARAGWPRGSATPETTMGALVSTRRSAPHRRGPRARARGVRRPARHRHRLRTRAPAATRPARAPPPTAASRRATCRSTARGPPVRRAVAGPRRDRLDRDRPRTLARARRALGRQQLRLLRRPDAVQPARRPALDLGPLRRRRQPRRQTGRLRPRRRDRLGRQLPARAAAQRRRRPRARRCSATTTRRRTSTTCSRAPARTRAEPTRARRRSEPDARLRRHRRCRSAPRTCARPSASPRRARSATLPPWAMAAGRAPQAVDARIHDDVVWILRRYRLRVTAAREAGHRTHGDGTALTRCTVAFGVYHAISGPVVNFYRGPRPVAAGRRFRRPGRRLGRDPDDARPLVGGSSSCAPRRPGAAVRGRGSSRCRCSRFLGQR